MSLPARAKAGFPEWHEVKMMRPTLVYYFSEDILGDRERKALNRSLTTDELAKEMRNRRTTSVDECYRQLLIDGLAENPVLRLFSPREYKLTPGNSHAVAITSESADVRICPDALGGLRIVPDSRLELIFSWVQAIHLTIRGVQIPRLKCGAQKWVYPDDTTEVRSFVEIEGQDFPSCELTYLVIVQVDQNEDVGYNPSKLPNPDKIINLMLSSIVYGRSQALTPMKKDNDKK